jgi:hypothetical protein
MRNIRPSLFSLETGDPMLILLIIPVVWAVALLLVAGLCLTARVGDSELSRDEWGAREESAGPLAPVVRAEPQGGAGRARGPRGARELAA